MLKTMFKIIIDTGNIQLIVVTEICERRYSRLYRCVYFLFCGCIYGGKENKCDRIPFNVQFFYCAKTKKRQKRICQQLLV